VADRTGHTSSVMINRYRRKAPQVAWLDLGPFLPLHEVVPELAALESGDPPAAIAVPVQPVQAAAGAGGDEGRRGS
jgi:hypothetical protein